MTAFRRLWLCLITKLQNLKAIHNAAAKNQNGFKLCLITKLQNLKAIHNPTN